MAATFEEITQQLTDYFANVGIYRYERKQNKGMLDLVNNALALIDYQVTSNMQSAWESSSRRNSLSFTLDYSFTSVDEAPASPVQTVDMISEKEVDDLLDKAEDYLQRYGMSLRSSEPQELSPVASNDSHSSSSSSSGLVAGSLFRPTRSSAQISTREAREVYEEGRKFIQRFEALKAKKAGLEPVAQYSMNELSFDGLFLDALNDSVQESSIELSFLSIEEVESNTSLNLSDLPSVENTQPLPEAPIAPVSVERDESHELAWLILGGKNLNDHLEGQQFRNFWTNMNFKQRFGLTADRTMRNLAYTIIRENPSQEDFATYMNTLRSRFNAPAPAVLDESDSFRSELSI